MPSRPFESVYQLLCPPIPQQTDHFARVRQRIESEISPHLPEWASAIGLQAASPQFCQDLIEAILLCILTHAVPPRRRSETRKILLGISKQSADAAKTIRRLDASLKELTPLPPGIPRLTELDKQASELAELSAVAKRFAKNFIDLGGKRRMLAFHQLLEGLLRAFESATGHKASVSWSEHKDQYEGSVLKLVKIVLKVVRKIAPNMPCPSSDLAENIYVYKFVNSHRSSSNGKATRLSVGGNRGRSIRGRERPRRKRVPR
jgi:hypothetical protein